jgi:hypothetical protein
MSDQVKQVALEEFEQAKVLARDAVRSAAYLYPLKVSLSCCAVVDFAKRVEWPGRSQI